MNCQKHLFSLPEGHHYLNCAYMSPLLKTVAEAGIQGIRKKQQPWHITQTDFFSHTTRLRELFARLVNAEKANQIAVLPATSYGISTIAKNLPKASGKEILVVGEQYPSNIYPWRRWCEESGGSIKTITAPQGFEGRSQKWNERILDAITDDTLMVALGNIHWTDGTLFDLQSIGKRAREAGAYFVIDGTQSVGALPIDVQDLHLDALICSGYKWLMGPYSIALGYFGERFMDGIPLEEGWIERKGSEDFAGLVNYVDSYKPGSIRYDVGESSNFILVPMMIKALEQILEWDPQHIQNYCKTLTGDLVEKLPSRGYKIENPEWRTHHLFGIYLPDHIAPKELQEKLSNENIHVSVRGSAIRISPNVYNNKTDIKVLQDLLLSHT